MSDTNIIELPPASGDEKSWSPLKLDYDYYDELFDDLDISEQEKREYLEAVWTVIVSFVDLKFRIHPVQQACEQDLDLLMLNLVNVLDSKEKPLNSEFNKTTQNHLGGK